MRVVFAASIVQKKTIDNLVDHLYHVVFPLYFDDKEVKELICWDVLTTPEEEDWLETANDAYHIIAALQVLISLLESNSLPTDQPEYQKIFRKNKLILERYQISFPFTYGQFAALHKPDMAFTMFSKVANEYLL